MNQRPNNPITNQLSSGVTETRLLDAVERSGYPLQTVIADTLRRQFLVQEEWSYLDRNSRELRTIGILAELPLHGQEPQPRIRPHLNLLIECKQSQLPYIFFLTSSPRPSLNFPILAGLREDNIVVTSDDNASTWTYRVLQALDLEFEPFQLSVPVCHTFSKCVRKSSELELSGSEAYNGVVLPLVKALQHFVLAEEPVETAWYFDAHLAVAIGVLDASMVEASVAEGSTKLVLLPWVRVLRHEYAEDVDHWDRSKLWVVDLVHKGYFLEYLEKHLIPFAQRFAQLVLKHQEVIASGMGFVSGMGKKNWDHIEEHLQPRPLSPSIHRERRGSKSILAQFFHRRRRSP